LAILTVMNDWQAIAMHRFMDYYHPSKGLIA